MSAIFLGILALALLFWVVEIVRAKLGHRPPSWKQPHEPPPPDSPANALWGSGIKMPERSDRKRTPPGDNAK